MNGKTTAPILQVDLTAITIDFSLVQQLPYALSRYYLALPLGRENGAVSVAMAYPENVKARQVLSRLLEARIVPVFTPVENLLPALERIYCPKSRGDQAIFAWCEQPEWETAVTTATSMLSETLHISATTHSSANLSLDEVFSLATAGHYKLVVMPSPAPAMLPEVLNQATTPLYFVRGEQPTIRRILVVLRGFASDEGALDWLTPFAWQQQAIVTLLPLSNNSRSGFVQYLQRESLASQHLDRCLRRLHTEGIAVDLKFRQGNPIQQVVAEIASNAHPYDLLVIAAEDAGDFVHRVIAAIEQNGIHGDRPIFVLKPPELTSQLSIES